MGEEEFRVMKKETLHHRVRKYLQENGYDEYIDLLIFAINHTSVFGWIKSSI
jgi:hypothetical protein